MLHRINHPACLDQLKQILQFQHQVLFFACNPDIVLPLNEQIVHDAFGPAGEWLWGKLWKRNGKKSEFHEALEKLMKYVRQNLQASQQILNAFEHDIKFHKQINNPQFQFSYTWKRTILDIIYLIC